VPAFLRAAGVALAVLAGAVLVLLGSILEIGRMEEPPIRVVEGSETTADGHAA
jgi:hypothetical protein